MSDLSDIFGEVIHSYSRAQAIEDGELVDVSTTAREAGFKYPVAVTRAVWGRYVEVPEGVSCQDEAGRLWDLCWMAMVAVRRDRDAGDTVAVELHVRNDNREGTPPLVRLKMVCGPGDTAEPVITIMLAEED